MIWFGLVYKNVGPENVSYWSSGTEIVLSRKVRSSLSLRYFIKIVDLFVTAASLEALCHAFCVAVCNDFSNSTVPSHLSARMKSASLKFLIDSGLPEKESPIRKWSNKNSTTQPSLQNVPIIVAPQDRQTHSQCRDIVFPVLHWERQPCDDARSEGKRDLRI